MTANRLLTVPYGCTHCGIARHHHGWRYIPAAGLHQWQQPTNGQILARMRARRAERAAPTT